MFLSHSEIDEKIDDAWSKRWLPPNELALIAEDIHEYSMANSYPYGKGVATTIKGYTLFRQGKYVEALEKLNEANQLLATFLDNNWNVFLYWTFFRTCWMLGLNDMALEHSFLALNLARSLKNESFTLIILQDLGSFYIYLGERDKGFSLLYEVLELAKKTNNDEKSIAIVSIYINLASAYIDIKDYANSIEIGKKLLSYETKKHDTSIIYSNLGQAYLGLGDYEQSKYYLEESLQLAQDLDLQGRQCFRLLSLGELHVKLGNDEKAINYLEQALNIAESIGRKPTLKLIHEALYRIYKRQEEWYLALSHHEQLYNLQNMIFNEESDSRIRTLEISHQVEELKKIHEMQKQEYDTLTELKNTLLSNVSHDLKNPLTTIKTNLFLARKTLEKYGLTQDDHLRFLDIIALQTDYMANLITDVLDMARLDTGVVTLKREIINIGHTIISTCNSLSQRLTAKSIVLNTENVELFEGSVDKAMFQRFIENIMSNAIKYTPENGIVEIGAKLLDNSHAHIYFKDTGVGIAEDELDKIFERFYRVSNHQDMADGTGLGLAICKNIIEQHNGKIEVESTVGEGTTFIIILPIS